MLTDNDRDEIRRIVRAEIVGAGSALVSTMISSAADLSATLEMLKPDEALNTRIQLNRMAEIERRNNERIAEWLRDKEDGE